MSSTFRARLAGLALITCLCTPAAFAQSISITGGLTGPETFDSLPNTGTGTTLPNGWYFSEVGTAANTTYAADNGALNTGNTYSYGSTGSTDRALGGLQSGSLNPTIGAQLTNNTGSTLTDLVVQYNGEQWRLGTAGRVDRLDFQYSLDATSLTTGTWNNVDTLDFTAPVTAGTVGALDGNAAANRTAISNTISGLSLANGATIWVRWSDLNATSSDDGLAVDDVQFGTAGDFPPTVTSTIPADLATGVAPTANVTINFSEPVTAQPGWYDISCTTSGTHAAHQSGGPTSFVIDPDTDFVNSEDCTVTVNSALIADQDGTPDPMAGDYRFSFTTSADLPPAISSTTPTNGATNVASTTNVTLKFTEAVAVTGSWYTISCGTSGTHTATPDTAGPASTYVLDPDVDFAAAETCTVTVVAADVTDQDGPPDMMTSNYVFSFTTAVGDAAPTVLRAEPADNAPSVPWGADISIFFSEAVTAPDGAFAINCAMSGAHPFVASHSAAFTRYLLNPTSDFAASEACTVTVTGAQVFDQDGTPNPMAADYVLHFTTQPLPTNYWAGVDTSSCTALRTSIHNKIKDHVTYMYSAISPLTSATATWNILEDADQDPLDSSRILDIYRNRSYAKVTDRSGNQDGAHYNREHTWPNSHGFNDANGLDANGDAFAPYTDTNALYLSAADYNADRGNNPYGAAATGAEEPTDAYAGFGGGTGTYPGNSNWNGATTYEVWNHKRGNAARAVLYMDVRYEGGVSATGQAEPDLIVTNDTSQIVNTPSGQIAPFGFMGIKSQLEQWHVQDPPDNAERLRNDIVYGYQGNRNPFIDHPEWVTCVFECDCSALQVDPIFKDGFE